ncbi:bcl-2-related protein A1 [Molossus molossus]|uniref:bcl-2-related protein A1 n=1 Tax=Molossus molossus TaxID=27622 RepID=UPI001745C9B2|nr:bcl-2-related protein A1 [Molossus molossus]
MSDCEPGYVQGLARDYLRYVLQAPAPAPGRASRLLQEVAFAVQTEIEATLKPVLDFDVPSVERARAIFNEVMEKEFEDGVVNWGRIVTVFAFEGILAKKLLGERAPDADTAQEVSRFVAEFLTRTAGEWIRQHGGWENGFVKKFEPKSCWLTFLEVTGKICGVLFLLQQYC